MRFGHLLDLTLLTLLSLLSPTLAQPSPTSTTVTVYRLYSLRPDASPSTATTVVWSGAVLAAAPTATTYSLAIRPFTAGFAVQTDITLVNGARRYAAWQVYNGSSTYGSFCDVSPTGAEGPVYECNVTYLGASGNGGLSTTFLETAANTYGTENRTMVGVVALLTEGMEELGSVVTAPPGEYTVASATGEEGADGSAVETAAASTGEGAAVETGTEDSKAVGRDIVGSMSLIVLAAMGGLVV